MDDQVHPGPETRSLSQREFWGSLLGTLYSSTRLPHYRPNPSRIPPRNAPLRQILLATRSTGAYALRSSVRCWGRALRPFRTLIVSTSVLVTTSKALVTRSDALVTTSISRLEPSLVVSIKVNGLCRLLHRIAFCCGRPVIGFLGKPRLGAKRVFQATPLSPPILHPCGCLQSLPFSTYTWRAMLRKWVISCPASQTYRALHKSACLQT